MDLATLHSRRDLSPVDGVRRWNLILWLSRNLSWHAAHAQIGFKERYKYAIHLSSPSLNSNTSTKAHHAHCLLHPKCSNAILSDQRWKRDVGRSGQDKV